MLFAVPLYNFGASQHFKAYADLVIGIGRPQQPECGCRLTADGYVARQEVIMAMFAVRTAKGSNWDAKGGPREQELWAAHARFMDELVEQGTVVLGGPIEDDDPDVVALIAMRAADEAQVRSIFSADPWTPAQILRIKDVRAWTVWLDGRSARSMTP
jgi:uncharacterized protein